MTTICPIDEYLFDRRSAIRLNAGLHPDLPPTCMPRALCDDLRFRTDTPHDDWDFLLRLSKQHAVRVETVPQILVSLSTLMNFDLP